jgi:hypothetical protein
MGKQGDYYWGVKVDEVISYKDLMLQADSVDVYEGALIFKTDGKVVFVVSSHNWYCFYAASCIDGRPICVEHWDPVERSGDDDV